MSSVQDIITSLAAVAEKPLSDPERFQLLGAIDKARLALEPPPFALQKLCFSPITLAVMRIAVGMKLFDVFATNPESAVAIEDVTSNAKGSEDLAMRVTRHLSTNGMLNEVSKGKYTAHPLALMCASTAPGSDAIINFYTNMKSHAELNEFLAKRNYESPDDAADSPWQFAYNTDKGFFDWLVDHPLENRAFNTCMAIHEAYRPQDWYEFYPVTEKLQTQGDRVTLVDIAGSTGGDIKKFHAKFPSIGKLVLQDLPGVVSEAKDIPAGIEVQAHDMFKPQPVKGAKAYYMRTVLHDWPTKQARQALQRVREVMADDSVLLLNDNVMGETGLTQMDTSVDFTMMAVFGARERTEQQWRELIGSAGLRITNVYRPSVTGTQSIGLFEAVPVMRRITPQEDMVRQC